MKKLNEKEKIVYFGYCVKNNDWFTVVTSEDIKEALAATKRDREHLTRIERKNCRHEIWGYKVNEDFEISKDLPGLPEGDPAEWYTLVDYEKGESRDE